MKKRGSWQEETCFPVSPVPVEVEQAQLLRAACDCSFELWCAVSGYWRKAKPALLDSVPI